MGETSFPLLVKKLVAKREMAERRNSELRFISDIVEEGHHVLEPPRLDLLVDAASDGEPRELFGKTKRPRKKQRFGFARSGDGGQMRVQV